MTGMIETGKGPLEGQAEGATTGAGVAPGWPTMVPPDVIAPQLA